MCIGFAGHTASKTTFLGLDNPRFRINDALRRAPNLDKIDLAILEWVEDDFDVSLETLAEELDLSKLAIHCRLNKRLDSDVIQSVTADVDPLALGLEIAAITNVIMTHERGYSRELGEKLMALDGAEQVYYTMGDADFIIISRVQTRDQLNDLIARFITIDRVNEISSKFVMQEFENDHAVTSNRTDEARAAILDWSVANETTSGQPNCPDSRCVSDPREGIS